MSQNDSKMSATNNTYPADNKSEKVSENDPVIAGVLTNATELLENYKDSMAVTSSEHGNQSDSQSIRRRSPSRNSSLNDDPRSLIDSISAASVHPNWSLKDMVDDDPSISSIKGDSVSATIADFNRRHRTQTGDCHSRTSVRQTLQAGEGSSRADDISSNINFYPIASGSTSGIIGHPCGVSHGKSIDLASSSSNAQVDAFDIIEEGVTMSSCEDITRLPLGTHRIFSQNNAKRKHHHRRGRQRDPTSISDNYSDLDNLPPDASIHHIEPIVIRGNGNLTLFGLSNSFSTEFPSSLIGKVSKEEFDRTMRRVNNLLRDQQSMSVRLLILGCLCCCCTLGFSVVWPSIALKKRSKASLKKFLAMENSRLYSRLGLNWKLAEQRCCTNHAFVENVILIEFTPKINLYLPD